MILQALTEYYNQLLSKGKDKMYIATRSYRLKEWKIVK